MRELRDVADEFINLEDVFFPKDKSKCNHVGLDDTFIPVKENNYLVGCLMKCVGCGELIEYQCPCAVGAIEEDPETGQVYPVLACDLRENERFMKGLNRRK